MTDNNELPVVVQQQPSSSDTIVNRDDDLYVIGFAGFAMSTMVLQFHNLGLCGVSPVIVIGFLFGGVSQMVAGLMLRSDIIASSAFVGYGTFWMALTLLLVFKGNKTIVVGKTEMGIFLVIYTIFTFILWVFVVFIMRSPPRSIVLFTSLVLGFVLLDIAELKDPSYLLPGVWVLLFCSCCAFYMMGIHIYSALRAGRRLLCY